jgi:hypothetical protein
VEWPEIGPLEIFCRDAYLTLSGEKQLGFGAVGLIPWSAVERYCEVYEVSDPEFLADVVFRVDVALQADAHRKNKSANDRERRNPAAGRTIGNTFGRGKTD